MQNQQNENNNNNIITLEQLQKEVGEWSRRNFPNNKPHHPLLGIIEENGEFFASNSIPEQEDAIGDLIIYAADYCERNELSMSKAFSSIEPEYYNINLIIAKLCHFHLKGEQGIRYTSEEIKKKKEIYIANILWNIANVFSRWQITYTATWLKVKQRDWQKNPINAAKLVEESNMVIRKEGDKYIANGKDVTDVLTDEQKKIMDEAKPFPSVN